MDANARGQLVILCRSGLILCAQLTAQEPQQQPFKIEVKVNADVMGELADGSGGFFFHNNNDLKGGLERLEAAPEYLYLLQVSLDDVKSDGTYHRLKVKVDREGLQLQARHGYFVPKPEKAKK